MNKHKIQSLTLAILAICASFAIWTNVLHKLPLPHISQEVVESVRSALNTVFTQADIAEQVTVQHVEIEDLAAHFVEQVREAHLSASLVPTHEVHVQQKEVHPVPVVEGGGVEFGQGEEHGKGQGQGEEVSPEGEDEAGQEQNEELHAAASEDLDRWELEPVWTIAIPNLGIRAPVLLPSMKHWSGRAWDMLEEQMQVGLNHGAVAYPHSSGPGKNGNLIIAGHSSPPDERSAQSPYGALFEHLPDISIGEEIQVGSALYRVRDKFVVSPEEVSILEQQDDESVLKLITCYPVGTTKERMIVVARKIQE